MSISESIHKASDRSSEHSVHRTNPIGEVFLRYGESYIKQYNPPLRDIKLIRAMRICKTPVMGGKAIRCTQCGHVHYIYFSCGHSHCCICQSIKREQWADNLKSDMYKVAYIHVIFTISHKLNGLAKRNKYEIYSLLMRSSWLTIKILCEDKDNVGALPGMASILHTFGSDMKYHLHTHNLVTFGGIDDAGNWRYPKRKDRLASYTKINSTFKKIFMEGLEKLYKAGKIDYRLSYAEVAKLVGKKNFVVHNTKPTMNTKTLEEYLARYINRTAISPSRVRYIKENEKVKIIYNDYNNQKEGEPAPKKEKEMDPLTFIHQYLQHHLPAYFQKSRRYGIHHPITRKRLADIIPEAIKRNGSTIRTVFEILTQLLKDKPYKCEKCESEEYEIELVSMDKSWLGKYIKLPKNKAPPIRANRSGKVMFG